MSTIHDTQSLPRPEYPRPQFQRTNWINLNGEWTVEFSTSDDGDKQDLAQTKGFDTKIVVPFAPESELSGVQHKDFIESLWYHRVIQAPETWSSKTILLNFGAVDYEAEVFVDGQPVGIHRGGSCPFTIDVTKILADGKQHQLVVHVIDLLRNGHQPSGKQARTQDSEGCYYTRTTGIWQTVWLEVTDKSGLKRVQTVPDFDQRCFIFTPEFYRMAMGNTWRVTVTDKTSGASETASAPASNGIPICIKLKMPKPWSPESPFLYDVIFEVLDQSNNVLDTVQSYAGLRKVHTQDGKIFLNNQPTFLRLILDQGFYPKGVWTAPSDDDLRHDIELSMKAGFNGARLHQKVFEERFHYHADRLGYLTFAEMPSWGTQPTDPEGTRNMYNELRQIIMRDRNHPSIIVWVPWNEHDTDKSINYRATMEESYDLCRSLDPTRPVNETSGWDHVRTDLYTSHNYTQNPQQLDLEMVWNPQRGGPFRTRPEFEVPYDGQPYLCDEWGGIRWTPENRRQWATNSWGYGDVPKTLDEFYKRLEGLTKALNKHKHLAGWCYTQLTDVEQEENGIYNYDRSAKFDMEKIRKIFSLPAAMESTPNTESK